MNRSQNSASSLLPVQSLPLSDYPILEALDQGVLLLSLKGFIEWYNQGSVQLLGITGHPGRHFFSYGLPPHIVELLQKALALHERLSVDVPLEGPLTRWVQVVTQWVEKDVIADPMLVVVISDITERKKLEQVRRDFVANVSHELKTPVTSIKGALETLQGAAKNDPAGQERFIAIAERQAERLDLILHDLLTLSHLEQDSKVALEKKSLLTRSLWESVRALVENKAAQRGIEILEYVEDELCLNCNRGLVQQALLNLVDNAIKYSPDGTRVTVCIVSSENSVRFEVQDEGIGIAQEHLPRIFERFYRIDPGRSRNAGGTGLGLAIVKHIALCHGGQVSVDSTPGKGTCFILEFPL